MKPYASQKWTVSYPGPKSRFGCPLVTLVGAVLLMNLVPLSGGRYFPEAPHAQVAGRSDDKCKLCSGEPSFEVLQCLLASMSAFRWGGDVPLVAWILSCCQFQLA